MVSELGRSIVEASLFERIAEIAISRFYLLQTNYQEVSDGDANFGSVVDNASASGLIDSCHHHFSFAGLSFFHFVGRSNSSQIAPYRTGKGQGAIAEFLCQVARPLKLLVFLEQLMEHFRADDYSVASNLSATFVLAEAGRA